MKMIKLIIYSTYKTMILLVFGQISVIGFVGIALNITWWTTVISILIIIGAATFPFKMAMKTELESEDNNDK